MPPSTGRTQSIFSKICKKTTHSSPVKWLVFCEFKLWAVFDLCFNPVSVEYDVVDLNTLKPRQNGCLSADDIIKCIFFNENVWISIKISVKFAPKDPHGLNKLSNIGSGNGLVPSGNKPLPEPMLTLHDDPIAFPEPMLACHSSEGNLLKVLMISVTTLHLNICI